MPNKRKTSLARTDQRKTAKQRKQQTSIARSQETLAETEARQAQDQHRVNIAQSQETPSETEARQAQYRHRINIARSQETPSETEARLSQVRHRVNIARSQETLAETEARQAQDRHRVNIARSQETLAETEARQAQDRHRARENIAQQRTPTWKINIGRSNTVDQLDENIIHDVHTGGSLYDVVCPYCKAFRYKSELCSFCCGRGKVILDPVPAPPQQIKALYTGENARSRDFLTNSRAYNNILSLASIGCKEHFPPGNSHFAPVFTIEGKLSHRHGSLLPSDGEPKFMQIYFYDTDNELKNRTDIMDDLDKDIILQLQETLHDCNNYVKSLKSGLEQIRGKDRRLILHADKWKKPKDAHCRTYNLPTASEVAIILPGDFGDNMDIIIQEKGGKITRINSLHRSYDPLHYVTMFPYGTDGYQLGLKKTDNSNISPTDYYRYRLQVRQDDSNILMRLRRLTQQYAVDMWTKVENSRMNWVRLNQKAIGAEKYSGLMDAASNNDLAEAGQRIILPPSITGSPRFYHDCFQSAMAIVRVYGKPDFFITFTTNPKWEEIKNSLNSGESPSDRPDIEARVFHMKLEGLMNDLLQKKVLGKVEAYVFTIEYQKRGLVHAHILLIMQDSDKPKTPESIDRVVFAELPDPLDNPELYAIVTENNIHGPCGPLNPTCVCMDGTHCTKEFPKAHRQHTMVREDSYPEYRRRGPDDGGQTCRKKVNSQMITVDNGFVVPYNPYLSSRYKAHINVEVVHSVQAVKYLYKYITKGQDRVLMLVGQGNNANDEVERFLNARYVSASEAYWRLYGFPLHRRYSAVEKLPCHLPEQQTVIFENVEGAQAALIRGPPETKLTAYFKTNATDSSARTILYVDFPRFFTWNTKEKKWQRRRRGLSRSENNALASDKIGPIPTISLSPHQAELFHLRMMLFNRAGATSYEDLRTVDGTVCPTYQEACRQLGLLDDDGEIDDVMEEASSIRFGDQLRDVFATILMYCRPSDPAAFWEKHKRKLCEDIMHRNRIKTINEFVENEVLLYLQDRVQQEGLNIHTDFLLPMPDASMHPLAAIPRDIREETMLDFEALSDRVSRDVGSLTSEQKVVFESVIWSVQNGEGRLFNLDAPGGMGKTFTLNLILDSVRSRRKVALAMASSGIAASLLHLGRTIHGRLKVPLATREDSMCSVTKRSATGRLLAMADLMVIDEISMSHRFVFECVDRTCQDIRESSKPFGGITVLFASDFRQILPVVPHGSRISIVNASFKSSYLWPNLNTLQLTKNMRVENSGGSDEFAKHLLRVGNGQLPILKDKGEFKTTVTPQFLLKGVNIQPLIDFVFPHLADKAGNGQWLASRAIICPTNSDVDEVNEKILKSFPGEMKEYRSADSIADDAHQYAPEFLNRLTPPGIPPHRLLLKVKTCIMLLRNLDPANGHTNGTRYIVVSMQRHLIEARVALGPHKGKVLFIPRIPFQPMENTYPFEFKRLQFPVRSAFAITANKSQGQTLSTVGILLKHQFFTHGQLYVAQSRVGDPSQMKIMTFEEENLADNVVYPEVL